MLATYSTENTVNEKLQELNCALVNFCKIADVGRTRLTEALTGKRNLEQNDADHLLRVLGEMDDLRKTSLVAPDWADSENVRSKLQMRRMVRELLNYEEDRVKILLGLLENGTV